MNFKVPELQDEAVEHISKDLAWIAKNIAVESQGCCES